MAQTYTHHEPFNEKSRESPALAFIEQYMKAIDSPDRLSRSPLDFYAPSAVYRDMKGEDHTGGDHIWEYIDRQLSPFSHVRNEIVELRVVQECAGREVIYGEFLTHFRLKGDDNEIHVPRMFVWTLGMGERSDTKGKDEEGLRILELRLFMDTGVIGRFVTEKKRKALKRGSGNGVENENEKEVNTNTVPAD